MGKIILILLLKSKQGKKCQKKHTHTHTHKVRLETNYLLKCCCSHTLKSSEETSMSK